MLSSKVKFPPVKVKLHWPDRWCKYCLQETEYLPLELYQCPSCGRVSTGRTEYIDATVIPVGVGEVPQGA